jgi:hypothetical protein
LFVLGPAAGGGQRYGFIDFNGRLSIRRFRQAGSGRILLETNPFTGSAVIPYTLPIGANLARLQISDLNGRVLAVIMKGKCGTKT